jgi:hypothetical protein
MTENNNSKTGYEVDLAVEQPKNYDAAKPNPRKVETKEYPKVVQIGDRELGGGYSPYF